MKGQKGMTKMSFKIDAIGGMNAKPRNLVGVSLSPFIFIHILPAYFIHIYRIIPCNVAR